MMVQRKQQAKSQTIIRRENRNDIVPRNLSVSQSVLNFPAYNLHYGYEKIPVYASQINLQPKLKVNTPGDAHEQQADAMAEKITQPHSGHIIPNPLPVSPENKTMINPELGNRILSDKGNGLSMDINTNKFMSGRFGFDFSRVKIHAGNEAEKMSDVLNARAFTAGNDIWFNKGEYDPESREGKKLLTHELTHVVQQQGADNIQRAPKQQAPVANWWDDKSIGIKPQNKFWEDMELFFPKDKRKFSGSGMGNVTNIECDDRGMVYVGKAYWDETDGLKRKAWILPMIEKRDEKRFDEARIDNEDLTNARITGKLKALGGKEIQSYIKKLTAMGKFIPNDQVIAYLNEDEKGKSQIIRTENEKLLDWKFEKNRLTNEDLKDEKTTTRLRGLSTADKLDKETKASEFAKNTGEDTLKLQRYLHTQTTTSTPLQDGATLTGAGGFVMNLPNVDVIVLPDTSGGKGNETTIRTNLPQGSVSFSIGKDGLIKGFFRQNGKTRTPVSFPSKLVITIQTRYHDISDVDKKSAYGRGTTAQDIQWGGKTLRFHEGSHGKGYLDFIKSHTFPSIAVGSVKPEDLKNINDMVKQINGESCQMVDQVGTAQDDYLKTPAGKQSGIISCNN